MGDQASSVYPWAQYPPGVTLNGGIPTNYVQFGSTLTPVGGGADDSAQINTAIANAGAQAISSGQGQIVKLSSGIFYLGSATGPVERQINLHVSNVILRGTSPLYAAGSALPGYDASGNLVGTHSPATDIAAGFTGTCIYDTCWDSPSGTAGSGVVSVGSGSYGDLGTSINLAVDGKQGALSVTLASTPTGGGWSVGSLVLLDLLTANTSTGLSVHPDVYFSPSFVACGSPTWCENFFSRQSRSITAMLKITNVSGNVVSFESPLAMDFPVAFGAQLTPFATATPTRGSGVEELYLYGGHGGFGPLLFFLCDGCWFKHCEAHLWHGSASVFYNCYRCEGRDSFLHEPQAIFPGGGAYVMDMAQGSSNCLYENNIAWNGDKAFVTRGIGGGNVVAYCYIEDAWVGPTSPSQAESIGGHYTTPHFMLLEGNWSYRYNDDTYWGNSIYITAFRNWFTGLRGARGWLANFTSLISSTYYPYGDFWTRSAVDMDYGSRYHNLVGNVLGFSGQVLFNGVVTVPDTHGTFTATQTAFHYEVLDGTEDNSNVPMWLFGAAASAGYPVESNQHTLHNRQGNFDYVTNSQIWYRSFGGSGTTSTGPAIALPYSLYLPAKPAFMGANTWPWVDPGGSSPGTRTYVLPAKARFDNGTPNA